MRRGLGLSIARVTAGRRAATAPLTRRPRDAATAPATTATKADRAAPGTGRLVHRRRYGVNEAVWIAVERKALRRPATRRSSRSCNAAIGGEAHRIVDVISAAVH